MHDLFCAHDYICTLKSVLSRKGGILYMREQNWQNHVYLLGLAGGKGTRLWPLSHKGHEKQFCTLDSTGTFIQVTIRRYLETGIQPTRA